MARNFVNCVFIFVIQITLVFYALYQIFFVDKFEQAETLNILVTRFLSAIILHINIESDMRRSLSMFNFALFTTCFSHRKYPQIAIALMNFYGTFLCEVANLMLLCTIDSPQEIIINMIGFLVIAETHRYYAKSLQNQPLKEKVH